MSGGLSKFSKVQRSVAVGSVTIKFKMPLMSGASGGVSLSDEAAVKTRLLFDGDGTGEERRLNVLYKSVQKRL